MSDPDFDAALKEAFASSSTSADDTVVHTMEIRHQTFVDDDDNPTSIFLVHDHQDFEAMLEEDAPIKGGQTVTFVSMAFSYSLAPIETSPTPQMLIEVDNVGREIIARIDAAVVDGRKAEICYRPYLNGDRTGPKMSRPPVYTLSEVKAGVFRITARANTGTDLGVAFPRELYKPTIFKGLIGL